MRCPISATPQAGGRTGRFMVFGGGIFVFVHSLRWRHEWQVYTLEVEINQDPEISVFHRWEVRDLILEPLHSKTGRPLSRL